MLATHLEMAVSIPAAVALPQFPGFHILKIPSPEFFVPLPYFVRKVSFEVPDTHDIRKRSFLLQERLHFDDNYQ